MTLKNIVIFITYFFTFSSTYGQQNDSAFFSKPESFISDFEKEMKQYTPNEYKLNFNGKLPEWLGQNFRSNNSDSLSFFIGISDPFTDSITGSKQALERAFLLYKLHLPSIVKYKIENFKFVNKKKKIGNSKLLISISSKNKKYQKINVRIINYAISVFNEYIYEFAFIKENNQQDTADSFIVDFFINDFNINSKLKNQYLLKINYTGYCNYNKIEYKLIKQNRRYRINSFINDSLFQFPIGFYNYKTEINPNIKCFGNSGEATLKNGLWAGFIQSFIFSIVNYLSSQNSVLQSFTEQYNDNNKKIINNFLQQEINTNIVNISIVNNKIIVNTDIY